MKKLLLIIALTLTANAESLCDMYSASISSNMEKGTTELKYGDKYMAKVYLTSALHAVSGAKQFCHPDSLGMFRQAKVIITSALDQIGDVK